MMALPAPSPEQQRVIDLLAGGNVVVDAVAGSGKTTTILHIAAAYRDAKILSLTYNARLKLETAARAAKCGLDNLEVRSYHSFGCRYASPDCYTDIGMIKYLRAPVVPITGLADRDDPPPADKYDDGIVSTADIWHAAQVPQYATVIFDEAQDMTPLYHEMVKRVLPQIAKVCILGDRHQSIYGFGGADSRFITMAPQVFRWMNDLPWNAATLSTSYRITRQMALFLNKCVLGEDRMIAQKDGPRPIYMWAGPDQMCNEVIKAARQYGNDNVFILAASVRSKSKFNPVNVLANKLTANSIKIYIPFSNETELKEDLMRDKVVFSSFHQAKGLERKCVFVLGFDLSYLKFYDKAHGLTNKACPNAMYVALTRAAERLVLFCSAQNPPMPFIRPQTLGRYGDVRNPPSRPPLNGPIGAIPPIGVTDLVHNLPSWVIHLALNQITVRELVPAGDKLHIPCIIERGKEEVSDLTGIAIPAYCEYKTTGRSFLQNDAIDKTVERYLEQHGQKYVFPPTTVAQWLIAANVYSAMSNQLHFRTWQIEDHYWMTHEEMDLAAARLIAQLSVPHNTVVYEVPTQTYICGREIRGRIDIVDGDMLWEIKCVAVIRPEHILQAAMYKFMYPTAPNCRLINLLTGEILAIDASPRQLEIMAVLLVHAKYHIAVSPCSDQQFIETAGYIEPVAEDILAACPSCRGYWEEHHN